MNQPTIYHHKEKCGYTDNHTPRKRRYRQRKSNGTGHSYRPPIFNSPTGLWICPYECGDKTKDRGSAMQHIDRCKKNLDRPLVGCKYKDKRCPYNSRSVLLRVRHEKNCRYNPNKTGDPCTFQERGCTYKHDKPTPLKRHQNICFYNPNKKSCPNANKGCPFINAERHNIENHKKKCQYGGNHETPKTIVPPPPSSLPPQPPPHQMSKHQPVYNIPRRKPISSIPMSQYLCYYRRWGCPFSDTKLSVVANHAKTCKHNPANRKR